MKLFQKIKIWLDKPKGSKHELMCFKEIEGKFYVVYPDNKRSQKMDYYCARNYAEIFKGKVHHIKYGEL